MKLRPFTSPIKGRFLLASSLCLALLLVGTASYFFGARVESRKQAALVLPRFAPLPTHAPIPDQPEVTQADIAKWSSLTNSAVIPQNDCPAFTTQNLLDENLKVSPTVSMPILRAMPNTKNPASALWLNKSSVTCNSIVSIHAAIPFEREEKSPSNERRIVAIRIGWYGGAGGREVWSSKLIKLKKEKLYQPKNNLRTIETRWPETVKMKVDRDWTPGFYIIATENEFGQIENYAPLILRSPVGSSAVALIHSTLTWQAYNEYGDRSLYRGPGLTRAETSDERSRVASFDRPFGGSGSLLIRRDALPIVELAESRGILLDNYADTDLHDYPSLTKSYNELVFSGHPEYWTQEMFTNVIAARNSGVNLAFFGGNTAYWRARVEPSSQGPNRHVVVFRNASQDPVTDPHQVSVKFLDPGVNQPGALLDGGFTSGIGVSGTLLPLKLPAWLGVPPTTALGPFTKWTETESPNLGDRATPTNIHILFQGKFVSDTAAGVSRTFNSKNGTGTTFWFPSTSGAATFNAGVNLWVCNLEKSCPLSSTTEATTSALQTITANVIAILSHRDAGVALSRN